MKYSAYYEVFTATFHVLSQKIDNLWDSVAIISRMLKTKSTPLDGVAVESAEDHSSTSTVVAHQISNQHANR